MNDPTLPQLPDHLSERSRSVHLPMAQAGEYVLYWMRTAMRADENPALDAARHIACEANLPLLVYQGLSERYPFASDRHHTFVLQGVRNLQCSFAERGVRYGFHLERPDDRGPHLRRLAENASLIVTEDMPTDPARRFLRALCRNSLPLLLVDTACVVPMQRVGNSYDRAYAYRQATQSLYEERVAKTWPDAPTPGAFEGRLAFDLVVEDDSHLSRLVAECQIDHLVGPVLDTLGGSEAGYQRWQRFTDSGIKRYAKTRNSALLDGVSRMSAYLHYGMVSPFRLAREAQQIGGAGAEKYLDELLIWRELAYCFCRFNDDFDGWKALPSWAIETLMAHASDSRSANYTWEQLARGETHSKLWNMAQKSLLIHGELHNNVRMTWGKALLDWTETPQKALQWIVDLNHRYALDGRDPASYGGILWCLGQFDRPFEPEQPVLGKVRPRPLDYHAQRLDVGKYQAQVSKTRCPSPPRVAIVGAGLSGAIAARTLQDHGLEVAVFEKSRGVGGRMAQRRREGSEFDHGAQYFTARDKRFARYVETWTELGVCELWNGKIAVFDEPLQLSYASEAPRFVAKPGMNSLAKHLLEGVAVHLQHQVDSVQETPEGIALEFLDREALRFEKVIVSAPAPQSLKLTESIAGLPAALAGIELDPCWATLVHCQEPLEVDWVGAFINTGLLRWVARNGTKPGRSGSVECLVLHADAQWSRTQLERNPDEIGQEMLQAFREVVGIDLAVANTQVHRWRYSIPPQATKDRCFESQSGNVLACGDWAGGPRVEGAFLSGASAAGRILGSLARAPTNRKDEQLSLF